MRRRFLLRFLGFLVAVIVVLSIVVAVVVDVVTSVLGGRHSVVLNGIVALVVILVVAFGLRRLVRGTAAPVGDLIEAAGRVEAGEVGAQVDERGPAELRSLARAFNAMSARLSETDEARRRLLADVSHELRTPLTVMQGTLEGMLDGLYPLDAAHLAPVLDETRVLARVVDDLRTLSLSEAGTLRLHREPADLPRLVAEVVAAHRAAADAAGVSLRSEAVPTELVIDVDPARIRQVLGNLIANALRFTPAGGEVLVRLEADERDVAISVRDTGEGMEPEAVEHAFDRFYRSPASPGSGLGLAIARNLVEAHGGSIAIESAIGTGTTVRFTLPIDSGA
jgi:two-component system, OmpR family, sensor histidine kinase BaeS